MSKKKGITISKVRSKGYALLKFLGDVQAVTSGDTKKIGKRVGRRIAGKAAGRGIGKIFKSGGRSGRRSW